MVGAGFVEDHDTFLGAERGDDKKRLNERGSDGQYRDDKPNTGRPAVLSEQTKHRRSGFGSFYFRKNRNRSFS